MTFTLTKEHIESLATPAKGGDLMPWIGACDEKVKWRIGASEEEGKGRSGVYVGLYGAREWNGEWLANDGLV